mgnify:CR=1 FL=1
MLHNLTGFVPRQFGTLAQFLRDNFLNQPLDCEATVG